MGVPVLTLSGRGFAARVCGSLVRAAGLQELICETAEDYVERAVALSANPGEVAALKARLEAGRATCDLFNMDLLTERLEELYLGMCQDHQRGLRPRPDLTNLDLYLSVGAEDDHETIERRAIADYHGLYRAKLAQRHRMRPISPDRRLWNEADAASLG
jgi:hypothetical protein